MNVNNVTVIIKYLSQTDPCLREIIRSIGDFSVKIRKDPFQSLVESIIYQQVAGSAARVIYSRFIKYYNNDNNNINSRPSFLNRYFQLLIQYLGHRLGYQLKK